MEEVGTDTLGNRSLTNALWTDTTRGGSQINWLDWLLPLRWAIKLWVGWSKLVGKWMCLSNDRHQISVEVQFGRWQNIMLRKGRPRDVRTTTQLSSGGSFSATLWMRVFAVVLCLCEPTPSAEMNFRWNQYVKPTLIVFNKLFLLNDGAFTSPTVFKVRFDRTLFY